MVRVVCVVSGLLALDRNNSFPSYVHRVYLWFCLGFFCFFVGVFCRAHHEPGSAKTREIN